ncbi:MAG: hypothetical protein VB835_08860 [Pirellulales bacterium]|jgi:hypothetical protein
MHYVVTARFKPETAADFYEKLTDGTIDGQKPDGKEIVASMKRAKNCPDGTVRWSEACYCPTPLEHERETVYDHFFEEIQTEEIEDYVEFEGEGFMQYLAKLHATGESH